MNETVQQAQFQANKEYVEFFDRLILDYLDHINITLEEAKENKVGFKRLLNPNGTEKWACDDKIFLIMYPYRFEEIDNGCRMIVEYKELWREEK